MRLTLSQKADLFRDGYLVIPEVVPAQRVAAALRAINQSIGCGSGCSYGAMDLARLLLRRRARKYCHELTRAPVILDLVRETPAWTLAESAIGPGRIRPLDIGQIALRFPLEQRAPSPMVPHLDGMHSPTNGLPKGQVQTFSALIGILLCDLPNCEAGNFTVWPGTHRRYEQYFREHAPESLLKGMPPIDLPQPRQITGSAGDMLFCHYMLGHGVAPNLSPHVRYAVYFRLSHAEHSDYGWASLTDIWREWEGMREIVAGVSDDGLGLAAAGSTFPSPRPRPD